MIPLTEHLMKSITQINVHKRFWIKAIDDLTLISKGGSFLISQDGDNWTPESYMHVSKGSVYYICLDRRVNPYNVHFFDKDGDHNPHRARFDIGGDIRSYLWKDYKSQKAISPRGLIEAFATSGVVHAHNVDFSRVDNIELYGCCKMFSGCGELLSAPNLPTRFLNTDAYNEMFSNCRKLIKGPQELPALTLCINVYENMFLGCRSLVESPVIYGDQVEKGALSGMFYGCTSLKKITCLITTDINWNRMYGWVVDVPSNGIFIKNRDVKLTLNSDNGVPKKWTIREQ